MRIARFDEDRLGVVTGEEVADVTDIARRLPAMRWPLPRGDVFFAHFDDLAGAITAAVRTAPRRKVSEVRLLSPVANPGKLIAAPVNYRAHIAESREDAAIHHGSDVQPIDKYALFLKANSSLVGAGEGIVVDRSDRRTDHEVELALVIGEGGRHIAREDALDHVAGYTIGLDITIRGTEDRSYRKSRDTFSVLGPWLVTADEFGEPGGVSLSLSVNGEPRQQANTRDLIWDVPKLIEVASEAYTLDPGDVIFTGTPEGVGPIEPGDVIEATIERIGTMRVAVR